MKLTRLVPVLGLNLVLAACATPFQVADVNEVLAADPPAAGSAFTKALFSGYKEETRHEALDEHEWRHASVFARKALRVAAGEVVPPEELAGWCLPEDRVKELGEARARLMGHFASGARERVPAAAATAQTKFDCWVEEEAERETDSSCRAAFLKVEPELRVRPAAAVAPAPAAPRIVKTFVVYFDFNKASLTKDAQKVLKEVAAAQADIKPGSIYVSGHTDTVGNSAYNDKLSNARANAVAVALAKLGVAAKVDQKAFGKTKLAVPTRDNTKEGKNRRVEIHFEK